MQFRHPYALTSHAVPVKVHAHRWSKNTGCQSSHTDRLFLLSTKNWQSKSTCGSCKIVWAIPSMNKEVQRNTAISLTR
ncbi:hypothetical protein AMELA_G00231930 [Ameiurus melas]|uniref:Uncharacterized protein n=1 Tax=Ameiurus melas TaxID=219545 RepID=A0A7J5ZXS2_AMEME|nr:hypothetical protein AMELA_G00231930 [Ameiurus melas]